VEDQNELLGLEVGHELVSNRLNLKKYIYVFNVGLIFFMFNKAGFRFQKVSIYNSLYLTKMSNTPTTCQMLVKRRGGGERGRMSGIGINRATAYGWCPAGESEI